MTDFTLLKFVAVLFALFLFLAGLMIVRAATQGYKASTSIKHLKRPAWEAVRLLRDRTGMDDFDARLAAQELENALIDREPLWKER